MRGSEGVRNIQSGQSGNSVLMYLSAEDVSEFVYFAYLVDEDAVGYAAVVACCPKLLKPIVEIKTTFSKLAALALLDWNNIFFAFFCRVGCCQEKYDTILLS